MYIVFHTKFTDEDLATLMLYAFDGKSWSTAIFLPFLCVITLLVILLIVTTLIYYIILLFISYIIIVYHIQMQHAVGFYIEVCHYLDWCKFWNFHYLWINSLCFVFGLSLLLSLFFNNIYIWVYDSALWTFGISHLSKTYYYFKFEEIIVKRKFSFGRASFLQQSSCTLPYIYI